MDKLFPPQKHNHEQYNPKAHPWIGTHYSDSPRTPWFRNVGGNARPGLNVGPQQSSNVAPNRYNANKYPYASQQPPFDFQQQQYANQQGPWAQSYPQYQQPGAYQTPPTQSQVPQLSQTRQSLQSDYPGETNVMPQSPYPGMEGCPQTCRKRCTENCPGQCCFPKSPSYFEKAIGPQTDSSSFSSHCPSECKSKCGVDCPQKCCGLNLCPFSCRKSCLTTCPKRCCIILKEYLPPLALPPLKLAAAVCPTHCKTSCSTDCPQNCCSRSKVAETTTKCPSICLKVSVVVGFVFKVMFAIEIA